MFFASTFRLYLLYFLYGRGTKVKRCTRCCTGNSNIKNNNIRRYDVTIDVF